MSRPAPKTPLSWDGRVEHVVAGQVTHFHALEELLAFMKRVLTAVSAPPGAECDQWAAPLHDTMAPVLAENLALLLPTDRVGLAPGRRTTTGDSQVLVEVTRFDGTMGSEVVRAARWRLAPAAGQELLIRQARCSAPAGGQDDEATATAMRHTLAALSRDIAAVIQTLAPSASTR